MMIDRILFYFTFFIIAVNLIIAVAGYNKKKVSNKSYYPFVSVITCSWNEEKVIERKINNYLDQNYPKNRYEIIIVDNGSTDSTKSILKKYKGKIKVLRLDKHSEYKSTGLDIAVKTMAKGEVILHSDADTICEKNWIRKMVTYFEDGTVSAVAGKVRCGNYNSGFIPKLNAIEFSFLYDLSSFGSYLLTGICFFCGANYGFRKSDFLKIGGHGKDIVEDFIFALKMIKNGMKIVPANTLVYQEEMTTFSQYVKQRKRWYYMIFNSSNYNGLLISFFKKNPLGFIIDLIRGGMQTAMLLNLILIFLNPYYAAFNYAIIIAIYLLSVNDLESPLQHRIFIPLFLIAEPLIWNYVIFALLKDRIKGVRVRWEKIEHCGIKFPDEVNSLLRY